MLTFLRNPAELVPPQPDCLRNRVTPLVRQHRGARGWGVGCTNCPEGVCAKFTFVTSKTMLNRVKQQLRNYQETLSSVKNKQTTTYKTKSTHTPPHQNKPLSKHTSKTWCLEVSRHVLTFLNYIVYLYLLHCRYWSQAYSSATAS